MYPHLLTWSFGRTFPTAKLAALSAILGAFLKRAGKLALLFQRENVLMMLLWLTYTVSTAFAINPNEAWNTWQDVSKLIVMALLTSILITDQRKLRYFFLVVAISLGFYGLKGGLFALTTRGEAIVGGPEPSIIAGNNNIGLALNMCLPILWYLAHEERGYLRMLLYTMFFLTVPSIMFTYSRASALTVAVVLMAIVFKGRNRMLLVSTILAGVMFALPLIPQRFWNRQNTTLTYEADASAMSRLDNWKFCWELALDRPFTGGGFNYNTKDTFARYAPEFLYTYEGKTWDTHSIYFAMLATHGFPGFVVFITMTISCFISCAQLKRAARDRAELGWVTSYCYLIEVSLLALLINGAFVNMEYFDLVYDLVGVLVSLKVISRRALSETEAEELSRSSELVPAAV